MNENEGAHETEIDWKWELRKLEKRTEDLLGQIAENKSIMKSLNARINRIWTAIRVLRGQEQEQEEGVEYPQEREDEDPVKVLLRRLGIDPETAIL